MECDSHTIINFLSSHTTVKQFIPQTEWAFSQHCRVRDTLKKQFASFLRKRRGDMTFVQFSKSLDFPPRRFIVCSNASRASMPGQFSFWTRSTSIQPKASVQPGQSNPT